MVILLSDKHQEWFSYLDELRDSGVTNMFGAAPYLDRAFGMGIVDARQILTDWMAIFSARSGDVNQYVDFDNADTNEAIAVMVDRLGTEVQPQPTAAQP